MGAFEEQCLQAHNQYRVQHGAATLTLDDNMNAYAAQWAQHLANRNTMQHRTNNRYGENIYMASGMNVGGADAVRSWYNEIKDYNYGRPTFAMNTGHFTQVVWKGSTKMGVGVAKRGNSTWVVANYDPPGNMMGQFQNNVGRK